MPRSRTSVSPVRTSMRMLARQGKRGVDRLQRRLQIAVDVAVERAQWRDVDRADGIGQPVAGLRFIGKFGQNGQERRQGFAASCRREDQNILAA